MLSEMLSELNSNEWRCILAKFKNVLPDVYYYPEYYDTWRGYEQAEPCCLYVRESDAHFIYPFFKKPIHGYGTFRQYFDIYSAYGYGGLLCSVVDPDESIVNDVNQQIDEWCNEQYIVAEFIRENYVHEYKGRCLRKAKHLHIRTNVYSDLTVEDHNLLSRHARRDVNFAARAGLTSSVVDGHCYCDDFYKMYFDTMKRINADNNYFFPKEYFSSLWRMKSLNPELILISNDKPVASAICFNVGHNYIYHLSASWSESLKTRPNDFLLYSIIQRAREVGKGYVFWGGGLTNDEDDSLFRFKSKYANISIPCHIGLKIHQDDIYQKLCESWEIAYPHMVKRYGNFLLKYRYTSQGGGV